MTGNVSGNGTVSIGRTTLLRYFVLLALAGITAALYLVFTERYSIVLAALAVPVAVLFITQPRWALYQFIFCFFFTLTVDKSVPLFLPDLSAMVVVVAATFDLLMSSDPQRRLPRLTFNFVSLLAAVAFCAVFAYDPALSLRPMVRITFLLVVFLSLYRLSGRVEVGQLIRVFFWICVLNAVVVVIPFIAAKGAIRSFGFAPALFDDLAMIALPIGLVLFIWSKNGGASKYFFASVLVFSSLIATQSVSSLVLAVFFSVVAVLLSMKRASRIDKTNRRGKKESVTIDRVLPTVKKRVMWIGLLALAVMTLGFVPAFREIVSARFEIVAAPAGSFNRRLMLWRTAIMAFLQHPFLGTGPGSFRTLRYILPTLHLQPLEPYVRGLSAHNLFLHYLAETGLLGTTALVALFVNQYRIIRSRWVQELSSEQIGNSLALYVVGLLFLITAFMESGWVWAISAYIFVFFVSLIVRHGQQVKE